MSWTADQLPAIARRVIQERQDGREVDPHRIEWAEWILRNEAIKAARPAATTAQAGASTPSGRN